MPHSYRPQCTLVLFDVDLTPVVFICKKIHLASFTS